MQPTEIVRFLNPPNGFFEEKKRSFLKLAKGAKFAYQMMLSQFFHLNDECTLSSLKRHVYRNGKAENMPAVFLHSLFIKRDLRIIASPSNGVCFQGAPLEVFGRDILV